MEHILVALGHPVIAAFSNKQKRMCVSELLKLLDNAKNVICISSFRVPKPYESYNTISSFDPCLEYPRRKTVSHRFPISQAEVRMYMMYRTPYYHWQQKVCPQSYNFPKSFCHILSFQVKQFLGSLKNLLKPQAIFKYNLRYYLIVPRLTHWKLIQVPIRWFNFTLQNTLLNSCVIWYITQ